MMDEIPLCLKWFYEYYVESIFKLMCGMKSVCSYYYNNLGSIVAIQIHTMFIHLMVLRMNKNSGERTRLERNYLN